MVYPDREETRRAQDREIEVARRRYYEGAASRWGVPPGPQTRNL
jgi:hypothetical protein